MNTPNLSIIIINWRSHAFVRDCLMSICDNIGSLTHEILVVDNASFDGCEEMVRSEFPHVLFIQSEHNLGFAAANNLAFARSSGRNVLFLNPDTEIRGAAIQELVSALECLPDAGMVGARLLNSDGSLQTTCITAIPIILNQTLNSRYLRRTFPRWKIWGMQALFETNTMPVPVEAISGACMLARREVIHRVGGFRTDYFMYAEDMDLCITITQAGWKIYYVPDAAIVHHAGGCSASREESNFSNIVLRQSVTHFFRLYRGPFYAMLYRASLALISILRIFILLIFCPILIGRWSYRDVSLALRKWWSIFLWSLGMTRWASRQSLMPKHDGAAVTSATQPHAANYSIDDRSYE
jgi:N-acetylglucosaminyl-diphospho-decaprenol L-rhamnosyltransferase